MDVPLSKQLLSKLEIRAVSVNLEIYYKYLCEFVLPLVANVSVILVVQMISFIVVGSS